METYNIKLGDVNVFEDEQDVLIIDLEKKAIIGYCRGKEGFKRQIERLR